MTRVQTETSERELRSGELPPDDARRISVIIPARNAEHTLPTALDSVLSQDYRGPVEVIVADGSDNPRTAEMLRRRYPTVRVVPNPEHIVSTGFNRALEASNGEIIVRCDAHTVFPSSGYVRRAVATLLRTGSANVGGRQRPVGSTMFERSVAMATTNFLGTGGPRYRMGGAEGPTDTAYLGVWRRETLKDLGGFDPTLTVNEDYDLNLRLRQRGETVWFDPDLVVDYRPRSSLRALARQYFNYGRWKSAALVANPGSLRVRQAVPPLFVLGLVASAALGLVGSLWAALLPLVYLLAVVGLALATGIRDRSPAAVLIPMVLATIHVCWGVGFFLPPRRTIHR